MKRSMLVFTLALVWLIPSALVAQEEPAPAETLPSYLEWPSALGAFASSFAGDLGGGGLHYQHWFDRWGLQTTFGGFYSPDASWGDILNYSVTLTGQYRVYGDYFARFFSGQLYLWALGGHLGIIAQSDRIYRPYALAGLGVGIELILFKHISIPFEVGYIAKFPNEMRINISFSGGLRYRYRSQ